MHRAHAFRLQQAGGQAIEGQWQLGAQETTLSFIGFERSLRQTSYGLQLGESRYKLGGRNESGLFVSANADYSNEEHSFSLSVDRQDTNTATGFITTPGNLDVLVDTTIDIDEDALVNANSNSAVTITAATARYSTAILCPRCELALVLAHEFTDFDATELAGVVGDPDPNDVNQADREENLASLLFSYRFSSRLTSGLRFSREYTTLIGREGDFFEDDIVLSLAWQATPKLGLFASAFNLERDTETAGDVNLRNRGFALSLNYLLLQSN